MSESDDARARLVGVNHVALEVGDVDAALEFYGDLFAFDLRSRSDASAFIDMGDQFLALSERDAGGRDEHRHFGLVVDDAEAVESALDRRDVERVDAPGVEFRDPWDNRVQVVEYAEIQLTKAEHVLSGMDLSGLEKSADAIEELEQKGMAPE